MRLLADECVAGSIVRALRNAGFDVAWITEIMPGASDTSVLDRAWADQRILLTEDKDFGDLTVRLGFRTRGVILLALAHMPEADRSGRAVDALKQLGDSCDGCFSVVEQARIRRRPLHGQSGPPG